MGETTNVNRQIAEALGYTVQVSEDGYHRLVRPDGTVYGVGDCSRAETLQAYYASDDEQETWGNAPDYEHDFNAFLQAIDGRDLLVKFQPDQPLTVTLYDTGYSLYSGQQKAFVASETDDGEVRPTVQSLAARALRDWLIWEATAYDNAEQATP